MHSNTARRILVAVVALAATAVPIAWSQIGGAASSSGPPPNATFDEIQYNQGTGHGGNYMAFVPATSSTTETGAVQSMVGGGGCSPGPIQVNPGNALLNISASQYPSGTVDNVGAYSGRTGVCVSNTGGDQAVDVGSSLSFAISSQSAAGSNRVIADAQIVVARVDKNSGTPDLVELIESRGGSQVAEQTFSVTSAQGAPVVLDAGCGLWNVPPAGTAVPCTNSSGSIVGGFDTVQLVNDPSNGSAAVSVAVVPSSIFFLEKTVCAPNSIQTSAQSGAGQLTAQLTMVAGCKSYSSFTSSTTADGTSQEVSFDGSQSGKVHFTVQINWAPQTECQPTANQITQPSPLPTCQPTQVEFNNQPFTDESFCNAATAANPLCVTQKIYNYPSSNGVTYTQISEIWDGIIDSVWRP